VRDSVSKVYHGAQEYVVRKARTPSGAGAFKQESRFEARITHLIDSPLWPLYFFRSVCVSNLTLSTFFFPESLLLQ
jgi:hypothetical protein